LVKIMAYTPTNWTTSTVMSTTLLNHAETQYDEYVTYQNAHSHTSSYYTKAESDAQFWGTHNDGPGSGSDADLIYYASGNLHAADIEAQGVPAGIIIMWYSSVGSIPSGWALCNGSGGTPDLRDKFIQCAGTGYSVGTTGGISSFSISGSCSIGSTALTTAQLPSHSHTISDQCNGSGDLFGGGTGCWGRADVTRDTTYAGGGGGHTHDYTLTPNATACLPEYHALCFIKRTS
jgi:hypothetical protein